MLDSESDVAQMKRESQAETPRSGAASRRHHEFAEQRTLQAQRHTRDAELDEAERQAKIQGNQLLKNAHKRICAIVSRFGTGVTLSATVPASSLCLRLDHDCEHRLCMCKGRRKRTEGGSGCSCGGGESWLG